MARDIFDVQASEAGVESEFSISILGMKHRNRLSPKTIRDLLQYKGWVVRHKNVSIKNEDGDMSIDTDSSTSIASSAEVLERERELAK